MSKNTKKEKVKAYFQTEFGQCLLGDSKLILDSVKASSIDLIVTSPPFGLVRKKDYGNVHSNDYCDWFRPFAEQFFRVLKDSGSLVIDIGGAWNQGVPTRSLYHFKLLIMLCEEFGFHLAQEYYWWNPSKLPSPAEWVNVRRIRVKDAVNTVWWLSKTEWPKASNLRVLQPYSPSMNDLLKKGYKAKLRPSGHDISDKFSKNNGAAIPPNLLAIPNTESNGAYMRYCSENNLTIHPARFPSDLPEYFIRMLTDEGDTIIDPFAGSCVTGEVAERLKRKWKCIELSEDYLTGAYGRFLSSVESYKEGTVGIVNEPEVYLKYKSAKKGSVEVKLTDNDYYKIPRPGALWNDKSMPELDPQGGRKRLSTKK